MKKLTTILSIVAMALIGSAASAASITGAGATFPYPLYAKWAKAYNDITGVTLNYQSIGSGGGIKQIKNKTVQFGASDKPLSDDMLNGMGLTQFPTVMGGVVPIVNVPGIGAGMLNLDGITLADIYLGKIKKWNDERIVKLNPGLSLPDTYISVVHRSDGSGTTFIFTNYLSKVSANWLGNVGVSTSVAWPVGLGGKGNEGVANMVKTLSGSIGYVEYAYALQNNMAYTLLKNKDGNFVKPDSVSFQAAASNADWSKTKGFGVILTDQPGAKSWPITGATFILMHKVQPNAADAKEVLKFFDWAYKSGSKMAEELHYIPMPANVVEMIRKSWTAEIKDQSGASVW